MLINMTVVVSIN